MKRRETVTYSLPMEDICVHITVQHSIAPVNVIQKPIQRNVKGYKSSKSLKHKQRHFAMVHIILKSPLALFSQKNNNSCEGHTVMHYLTKNIFCLFSSNIFFFSFFVNEIKSLLKR